MAIAEQDTHVEIMGVPSNSFVLHGAAIVSPFYLTRSFDSVRGDILELQMKHNHICQQCGKSFSNYFVEQKCCSHKCDTQLRFVSWQERFWTFVRKTPSCWIWTGAVSKGKESGGYGILRGQGRTVRAHRASFELHFGPISRGLEICHTCDNRGCVNPDHLFEGTQKDNMQDCAQKGRIFRAKIEIEQVIEIKRMILEGNSDKEIVGKFNLTQAHIRQIRRGKCWGHVAVPSTTI